MRKVWEFPLSFDRLQGMDMPEGAEILSAGLDPQGTLCLWALCDPDAAIVYRSFEIFGTGHEIREDPGTAMIFIDSVLVGPLVWHVFERTV